MARTSVLLKMQRLTDFIRYVKEHPEGADENTLAALWKCGRSTVYDRIRELNKETEEPLIVKAGRGRYTVNEELTPYVVLFDVKMVREWLILYLLQESGEKGLSRSQLETKYRELCAGIEDMAIAGEADYQDLDSDMKASGITLYGDLRQLCESGLVRLAGSRDGGTDYYTTDCLRVCDENEIGDLLLLSAMRMQAEKEDIAQEQKLDRHLEKARVRFQRVGKENSMPRADVSFYTGTRSVVTEAEWEKLRWFFSLPFKTKCLDLVWKSYADENHEASSFAAGLVFYSAQTMHYYILGCLQEQVMLVRVDRLCPDMCSVPEDAQPNTIYNSSRIRSIYKAIFTASIDSENGQVRSEPYDVEIHFLLDRPQASRRLLRVNNTYISERMKWLEDFRGVHITLGEDNGQKAYIYQKAGTLFLVDSGFP